MDFKALIAGGKAIPAHPALMAAGDAGGPLTLGDRQGRVGTPLSQTEAKRHLEAYGGSEDAIDWVMDCVSLIMETTSSAEWYFEKDGKRLVHEWGPFTPEDSEEAPQLLVSLLDSPNPYQDYCELIELSVIDFLLVGNAYWLKYRSNDRGQPLNLFRLAPPYVGIVPGAFGPEKYTYQVSGQQEPLEFDAKDVVHFRRPNPHSAYYGMGIVQQAARALDLELALTDTQASYYEKHAQPSLIVQSDRRVPDAVFRRLRAILRSLYAGPRNAGSLMVLEAGLKATSIAPNATEAAFDPLTKLSRDRIAAMFRVPLPLLYAGSSSNSSEGTQGGINDAQRLFDNKTIKPLLKRFARVISSELAAAYGVKFKYDYEYVMPIEDRVKLTSNFSSIPGVRVREVREYAQLEPLGDWRDDIVLNLPGIDGEAGDTRMGFPDRNLAGEAGRPPSPDNTEAFPEDPDDMPAEADVSVDSRRRSEHGKKALTNEDIFAARAAFVRRAPITPEVASAYLEQLMEGKAVVGPDGSEVIAEDDQYRLREAAINSIVDAAKPEIGDALHLLERSLLDHVEGKAVRSPLNRIKRSTSWTRFNRMLRDALERAVRQALSTAAVHLGAKGVVSENDIDYDALVKELLERKQGGVISIRDNLRNEIAQKMAKALEEGAERQDFERIIRESIDFWRETHAETVALTEAITAYNKGTVVVSGGAGINEFLVSDGEDHDEPCKNANGSTWTSEEALANPLEHPRCRRAFIPVVS